MNFTAAGDVPQWLCIGCDRPTLIISARINGFGICPTCEIRHDASPLFLTELIERAHRAELVMLSGLVPFQVCAAERR